jgi:hypothetical protein
MGDKYLPTKKDLKANTRYQQNLKKQSKFIPSAPVPKPASKPAPKK